VVETGVQAVGGRGDETGWLVVAEAGRGKTY